MSVSEDPFALVSERFWDVDFYKHTVKRTEDGLFMCNEMMKCVQERADIEKEYAKRLKGWAKKWNDSFERGMLYSFIIIIRAHSFLRQNLTNSAANFVNSAAYRGKADEIPRLTVVTQLNFGGLIKS